MNEKRLIPKFQTPSGPLRPSTTPSWQGEWKTAYDKKLAQEEVEYQKFISQPYFKTHKKPTKEEWRKLRQKAQNPGTITKERKVSAPVRAVNNYIGQAKYELTNNEVPSGKYIYPAAVLGGLTLGGIAAAPVTSAAAMAGSTAGGKLWDFGTKVATGKSWADWVSDKTGLAPEASAMTNLGMWAGGGLPLATRGSRTLLSAGDQIVKDAAKNVIHYGPVEAGGRAVEKYFPKVEDQIFKLPNKAQEFLYPFRQKMNYSIVYPRQNARISEALERIRVDPALQGKSWFSSDLSNPNHNSIRLMVNNMNGGLRSLRAIINPGDGYANTSSIKRRLFKEWNQQKETGDILTGDAWGGQDPINSIDNLNLDISALRPTDWGLSADSYKLIHDLGSKGNGMTIYSREPTGKFNPLAKNPAIYNLQGEYESGILDPIQYALKAENYFRKNGTIIRQPYVRQQDVLFQHPSYIEGLRSYIK